MNDDGYTLAEALAALAILGLAIGGLGLVAGLIARQQLTAARLHDRLVDARAAERALETLMADADPADLSGDAAALRVPCGGTAVCEARLRAEGRRTWLTLRDRSGVARRLRLREKDVRFGYLGPAGPIATWPPAPSLTDAPSGALSSEASAALLSAVVLRAGGQETPLALVRTWRREPRDCRFDPISGACRQAPQP